MLGHLFVKLAKNIAFKVVNDTPWYYAFSFEASTV